MKNEQKKEEEPKSTRKIYIKRNAQQCHAKDIFPFGSSSLFWFFFFSFIFSFLLVLLYFWCRVACRCVGMVWRISDGQMDLMSLNFPVCLRMRAPVGGCGKHRFPNRNLSYLCYKWALPLCFLSRFFFFLFLLLNTHTYKLEMGTI